MTYLEHTDLGRAPWVTACALALLAACSSESGQEDILRAPPSSGEEAAGLRVSVAQFDRCLDQYASCTEGGGTPGDCIEAGRSCIEPETAEALPETCFTQSDSLPELAGCLGFPEPCIEGVVDVVEAFIEGAAPPAIDLDACRAPQRAKCEGERDACDALHENALAGQQRCMAESLACDGIPAPCADDYAACIFAAVEPVMCTAEGCEELPERSPEDCEALLDACGVDLPPEPGCPPWFEGEEAPAVDTCHVCRCDAETGEMRCDDICFGDPGLDPEPKPEPEQPVACTAEIALEYGHSCNCDLEGRVCCWGPVEDEICDCPITEPPGLPVCLCVPVMQQVCHLLN